MSLANKVVLITGASEGIGAACVQAFREQGTRVSLLALPSDTFQSGEFSGILQTSGDITDDKTRREIVRRTIDRFGRIDILVNNVGVGQYGWPSEVDADISKRMFDVNVFAPLSLTQLVIPEMRRRKSGTIVNIGSVGGRVALPWAVMYCATKHATHCVDDALRRELAPDGIHVMKVCPGVVETGFRDNVLAGRAPEKVKDIRRVVFPRQVAEAIVRGIRARRRTVYVPANRTALYDDGISQFTVHGLLSAQKLPEMTLSPDIFSRDREEPRPCFNPSGWPVRPMNPLRKTCVTRAVTKKAGSVRPCLFSLRGKNHGC